MANNFGQADASLSNNSLTTVVSTTSNKQIVIGLLISNTGTASINVDSHTSALQVNGDDYSGDQTIDILLKERHYQLVVLLNVCKEK